MLRAVNRTPRNSDYVIRFCESAEDANGKRILVESFGTMHHVPTWEGRRPGAVVAASAGDKRAAPRYNGRMVSTAHLNPASKVVGGQTTERHNIRRRPTLVLGFQARI